MHPREPRVIRKIIARSLKRNIRQNVMGSVKTHTSESDHGQKVTDRRQDGLTRRKCKNHVQVSPAKKRPTAGSEALGARRCSHALRNHTPSQDAGHQPSTHPRGGRAGSL